MPPIVPQQARQVTQNGNVIVGLARWLESLPDTLDAPLTIRDRPLRFAPTRRRRQHDVGAFCRGSQKNILHH